MLTRSCSSLFQRPIRAGRSRLCRRESVPRASRPSRISEDHHPAPTLVLFNHRVRLLTDRVTQHHHLLKPIMKCVVLVAALGGAAFASLAGAMSVIIEAKEVKPAVPGEAPNAVMTEHKVCGYCMGNGCRMCGH
ncbi:hypothetical protein MJO29_000313 [Puccinia striiformis f. sp. tritici]|uniref:Uncharacterized protein n=1 Tax=Puccinia striiformis TaxID=27350 RepID=A0A2S4W9V3_9BASI|nr:hypothetical protein MJO29_000313 [Puccinia striiformis f. sp. tritici]KAI9603456.1 hypothetical protein KEM48_001467 [Puccinia striiformis f. sp. tritici PST-130]POW18487.1 hypothetical protein PSHT_05743 [Puccinia striiformis]